MLKEKIKRGIIHVMRRENPKRIAKLNIVFVISCVFLTCGFPENWGKYACMAIHLFNLIWQVNSYTKNHGKIKYHTFDKDISLLALKPMTDIEAIKVLKFCVKTALPRHQGIKN